MFNLIKNLFEGEKQMARTKQYVVYTREFSKGRVNNKVGVFLDEAKNALDNTSIDEQKNNEE